jgi:CheY-like chemotaxis protein
MKKTNRILAVDDNKTNRLLIKTIALELNIEYLEATNGKEAIDLLDSKPVDLILMDIEMPVMSGVEAIEFIRKKFAFPYNKTPIVVLTSHSEDDFSEMYRHITYDDIVSKPYTMEKIKAVIEKFFNQ